MNKAQRQRENATVSTRKSGGVDEYIARCPKEARGDLAKIRAAIRAAAPGATAAPIISNGPDIPIRELIIMTGCLPGSASRNHTYAYMYLLQ